MKFQSLFLTILTIISTSALASEPEVAVVKALSCASGELNSAKTDIVVGQISSFEGLGALSRETGGSIIIVKREAVAGIVVSGDNDGVCKNNNEKTLLIVTATK